MSDTNRSACGLCGEIADLRESHVVPAFVVRWLKETGATGYLRNSTVPNKRLQDIEKPRLLCQDCETKFSKDEGTFAREIFYPYVTNELDEKGHGQGKIKNFNYQEWLLRFAISVQWRVLATRRDRLNPVFGSFEQIWRQFLLGERNDTGVCETHLIFQQSLGAAAELPAKLRLGKSVNSYILRSVDSTTVSSEKKSRGVYAKLGPIVLYTSIEPPELKGNSDSKLHMKGAIKVGQHLGHSGLNQFLFITRPNETFAPISDKQNSKIVRDMLANPKKTLSSLTFHAAEADRKMKQWIE